MVETTRQSGHRPPERLLNVPDTMGFSHGRTQAELLREEDRPKKTLLHRATDYLKIQVVLWGWHYLKSRIGGKYAFGRYESGDTGVYRLDAGSSAEPQGGEVKMSLIGDWGSGTEDAGRIGQMVENGAPDFSVHLGDIYYCGTRKEIAENMLGGKVSWPLGRRGSFALNSNHEMYARGKGYFKHLLPRLGLRDGAGGEARGQGASYFALQSDHWLVIGLDTGYYSVGLPILEMVFKPSCKLHADIVRWLRDTVRLPEDRTRGVVLLSHHQYYSQFESDHDRAASQLAELIRRPVLWFWGHEHRLALYGRHGTAKGKLQAYGRCLGHGGLPIEDIVQRPEEKKRSNLVLYDRRKRTEIGHKHTPVGYNGYADLLFRGNRLTIEYRDVDDRLLVSEEWKAGEGGNLRGLSIRKHLDDPDLVIHEGASLEDAIG